MSSDLTSKKHQINFDDAAEWWQFDGFRLDVGHQMLYKDGVALPLTPKQVETLIALIENAGEIVSKDALSARIWRDTIVEESNLTQNIYILRKALGKSSSSKPFIETLRRRGYRFNGKVRRSGDSDFQSNPDDSGKGASGIAADQGSDRIGPRSRLRRSYRFVLTSAVIAVIALLAVGYNLNRWTEKKDPGTRSIAVLPIKPLDGGNSDALYEMGLADALINRLSTIDGVVVRPLSSTRKYGGPGQDPVVAGREQRTDYVITGSYQVADGRIRITLQLINVATGGIEKPIEFERRFTGIFQLQEGLASLVTSRVTEMFALHESNRSRMWGTSNEEAYRAYLQGMYIYDRRNPGHADKAIVHLKRAVSLDPNFALAWAGLAYVYQVRGSSGRIDRSSDYIKGMKAISRALAIDPQLSDAHAALCEYKFAYEFDLEGAEAECLRAIELGPNSSIARNTYAWYLACRGRDAESIDEIKIAIDLDPQSFFNKRIYANLLYYARRYPEAIKQYNQLLETDEGKAPTYQWLIRSLEASGNEDEAFKVFIRSLAFAKEDEMVVARYKRIFANGGWRGVLRERERMSGTGDTNYFRRAGWMARIGDKDKAFDYLERAFRLRDMHMTLVRAESQFDPLRDDPRYEALVKRIENR